MIFLKSIHLNQPIIKLSSLSLVLFSIIFTTLAVFTPWLVHHFNLAGPTFLPMHLFILIAALAFGWQIGLFVGVATPLISHFTSGMPLLSVLPQIIIELSTYGLVAGILREKFNLNIWLSLIAAMITGRFILGISIFF